MKYLFYSVIFLISFKIALANDSEFYSEGINIYPFNETVIELKKEILKLKITNEFMYVDVYFEFYNPLKEAKKILVGFVSPPPNNGVDSNQLLDFKIEHDGKLLSFEFHRIGELDSEIYVYNGDERDIAYTFNVSFNPGINIIKHSYKVTGGVVLGNKEYPYILKTGNNWANKQIDDFTLNIDFDSNYYVSIPASFEKGKLADWKFEGNYKLHDKIIYCDSKGRELYSNHNDDYFDFGLKLMKVKNTKLSLKINNFKPENNIRITTNSSLLNFYSSFYYGYEINIPFLKEMNNLDIKIYKNKGKLTKDEIKLYINFIYSTYDYYFKKLRNQKIF